ncbi:MAG: TolC family protein [bacterium]
MKSKITLCLSIFGLFFLALTYARGDTMTIDVERAMELALKNSYKLMQSEERVREAAAGKGAALGGFLPHISASGTYTRLGTVNEFEMVAPVYRRLPLRVYDPFTGEVIGFTDSVPMPVGADTVHMALGSQNNYLLRGTVQQTLFTWGKLINAYRIAGLTLEVEKAAREQARQESKFSALQTFYQALVAEKTAGLLTESYEQLQRHVDQVERLYEEGLASRLDLMRAQVSLTNMANQVEVVKSGAELARAALSNLLGLEAGTTLILSSEMEAEISDLDTTGALQRALKNRPELVQLRRLCEIADIGVRIARTANLPTLFATGNFDYKRPVGFQDQWGKDWNATVGVSWPIFTGLTNYHKLRQAKSQYRQAALSLKMVEDAIGLEMQAAVAGYIQEKNNIGYQEENVKVAEEAFQQAEKKYQNGLLSNLEFLDIQLQLTQSRVALLNALANFQVARARLLRAMGEF